MGKGGVKGREVYVLPGRALTFSRAMQVIEQSCRLDRPTYSTPLLTRILNLSRTKGIPRVVGLARLTPRRSKST